MKKVFETKYEKFCYIELKNEFVSRLIQQKKLF
jgi:hypothetical protein